MEAFTTIYQNDLNFKLNPISIRDIIFIDKSPCDLYGSFKGLYRVLIAKDTLISTDKVRELILENHITLYLTDEGKENLIDFQRLNLIEITRSLSVGNSFEKIKRHLNLLTLHFSFLYEDPSNDDILQLQIQSAQNLCRFLIDDNSMLPELYKSYSKQGHNFLYSQPLLSSLLLLNILKTSHMFGEKEIESLFISSYFKDIGMTSIPKEKIIDSNLTQNDINMFNLHPEQSVNILSGRINLGPSYLKIIENHHPFQTGLIGKKQIEQDYSIGTETILIAVLDIIVAMTSKRPYRNQVDLYQALGLVKQLIANEYSQEFKLLIHFFKKFFEKER